MRFRFKVQGFPPKKSGARSMWATDPDAQRLVALRKAAAAAIGTQWPLRGDVAVEVVAHVGPVNDRSVGDLDNYITGILDGLQRAAQGVAWHEHPAWQVEGVADIRPDAWCAFEDDVRVVDLRARKVVGSAATPRYEVTITDLEAIVSADAQWVELARQHLLGEVAGTRHLLRSWLAMRQANAGRWFGGSGELQALALNGALTSILLSVRRATDYGKPPDITLQALMKVAMATSPDAEARRCAGLRDFEALRAEPAIDHLRQIADKVIAHSNPNGLAKAGPRIEALQADQYTVSALSEAIDLITGFYVKHVEPDGEPDAVLELGDPFWDITRDHGLPVHDFPLAEPYRGGHAEDQTVPWFSVKEEEWEAVVGTVPTPWPRAVAETDARYQRARQQRGEAMRDPSNIAARWGWDLASTAEALFRLD